MTAVAALRGIVFDKDGTLFDYAASWSPINLRAALMASGGDEALRIGLLRAGGADPASGMAASGSPLAAGTAVEIARVWVDAGAAFAVDELAQGLDALFTASAKDAVPVTPLAPLMRRLTARGLVIAVVSSDSQAATCAALDHFGLVPHVAFVAGYDAGHGVKPDAGPVLAFCAHAGIEPRRVAVVGDNPADMLMARAAGAGLCVGVLTGTGTRETLAPLADRVIDGIASLETLIASAPA